MLGGLMRQLQSRLWRVLAIILACAALISTQACSDNKTSPTTPTGIPNVAGTWTGTYHIKTCTDTVNGTPGTTCAAVTDPVGGTNAASKQPVQLVLTQQNDQVGGTLVFSGWYVQSVPVTGTIGSSGRLWLQGTVQTTDTACPTTIMTFTLGTWFSDLNREQNEM